ncbi:MAG: nucleoside deaminase [Kiloniellales bacterium]
MSKTPAYFMALALDEARAAAAADEVPVGAVVVRRGEILARAQNRVERDRDPTAHAEILAIRAACRITGEKRLPDASLYVTLEPCAMCAQAIALAHLEGLVFAAYDPKGGGVDHGARVFDQTTCHHRPRLVGGLLEEEARELLKNFFRGLRST